MFFLGFCLFKSSPQKDSSILRTAYTQHVWNKNKSAGMKVKSYDITRKSYLKQGALDYGNDPTTTFLESKNQIEWVNCFLKQFLEFKNMPDRFQ